VGGTLFFSATDGSHGYQLWQSNGTSAGTLLVADINPTPYGGSNPQNLTNVGGTLFFRATDGSHGYELWQSNGTAAGTVLVADINPTPYASSSPQNLTNVGGTLFFSATDGSHGYQLWQSNGTSAGTALVNDITPGTSGSYPPVPPNGGGPPVYGATGGSNPGPTPRLPTPASPAGDAPANSGSSAMIFPAASLAGMPSLQQAFWLDTLLLTDPNAMALDGELALLTLLPSLSPGESALALDLLLGVASGTTG
jgi:ELWxxDGT repeat protein